MDGGVTQHAALVGDLGRRNGGLCAASRGLLERLSDVGHLERNDGHAISVLRRESRDRMVSAQPRREHEPDVPLLHDVRRDITTACFETPVRRIQKPEAVRIKGGRLPRIADVELEVVDTLDGTEILHIRRIAKQKRSGK